MAAYAALTSLMHIIEQVDHHHFPPIFISRQQVESLTKIVTFLQEFLEAYNSPVGYSEEADPVEMRIADAAYAAEDVIESYVAGHHCINFSKDLEQVIGEMDLIKMEVVGIVEERRRVGVQNQLQKQNQREVVAETQEISSMVGFDDVLLGLMDKLTAGRLDRQVIPIVGMAGIGKTTLARNVYVHPLIKDHFDICAWATISHQYSTQEILSGVLPQASKESKERLSKMSGEELGLALYQYLLNRRFLIVMDDMWSIEIWDEVKHFFPDNNNGSRVVVTTRLSELASQLDNLDNSYSLEMKFLDEDSSWNLFSGIVFGEKCFPVELGKIGGKIVRNCRGLPLSIVAIGGLLAESEHTLEYWEHIDENLNSIVNSDKDEHCLKILKLSYSHLPTHLKPCFLYMGVFDEDSKIRVSTLIRLWVSEGFLKPASGTSFETTAREYLKDLVARNLVLVHELGSIGSIKYCKIHDLLRDLCLREAQRERFYDNIKQCHEENVLDEPKSHSRSYVCDIERIQKLPNLRSLRTLKAYDRDTNRRHGVFMDDVLQLVNLRYLSISLLYKGSIFPSLVNLLWNLHTLIVAYTKEENAPVDIWKMPQLRHVEFRDRGVCLPHPPSDHIVVMKNLQTLTGARDFECSEEVVRRIPNVKKLGIRCHKFVVDSSSDCYCFSNLECLQQLESLSLSDKSGSYDHLQRLTFPHSLKKLSLELLYTNWDEMLEKIGSLPVLQKLRLTYGSFQTSEWNTVEDQFPSLKFLALESCFGLEYWTTESSHFPHLEHLRLIGLRDLKKIPSEIGEIPTLQSIELDSCGGSAVKSAQEIIKEQKELQGVIDIYHTLIGAEYGEGFETFRPEGPLKVDVDFLNDRMQEGFLQRIRYAMKPDEAYGLIFSWDVVADTQVLKLRAWEQLASEEGKEIPKDDSVQKSLLHADADHVLQKVLRWEETEDDVDRLKSRLSQLYYDNLVNFSEPIEGLKEWLDAVNTSRIPCAVVSSLDRKNMVGTLERMGLKNYFQAIVSEEDGMESMAHRFLSASVKLDRKPSKCVVFEDDPRGIAAAHNCTMMAIALIGAHPAYDLGQADLAVANFNDLSVINLRRLFAHKGSTFMELQKQVVEKNPPKRKLTIDTIF